MIKTLAISPRSQQRRASLENHTTTEGRNMLRRHFLVAVAGFATLVTNVGGASAQELPPLTPKDTYKVGFSQPGSASPWRIAQRESMNAEAAKLGHQLVYRDAGGSTTKQIADMEALIAQGV